MNRFVAMAAVVLFSMPALASDPLEGIRIKTEYTGRSCEHAKNGSVKTSAGAGCWWDCQSLLADGLLVPSTKMIGDTHSPSLDARFLTAVSLWSFVPISPTSMTT